MPITLEADPENSVLLILRKSSLLVLRTGFLRLKIDDSTHNGEFL